VRAGLAVVDAVGGLTTAEPLNVRLGVVSKNVVHLIRHRPLLERA